MDGRQFKAGDVVEVFSLQSFDNGGFLNGVEGIVAQDQIGASVGVAVVRNFKGVMKVDPFYEVYPEQLRLVSSGEKTTVLEFQDFLRRLKNGLGE